MLEIGAVCAIQSSDQIRKIPRCLSQKYVHFRAEPITKCFLFKMSALRVASSTTICLFRRCLPLSGVHKEDVFFKMSSLERSSL